MAPRNRETIFFDGVCNLCNSTVQFVIARDPEARFQFAALQSDAARKLLGARTPLESIVLVETERIYTKSTAVLRIARGLRFPWPLLYALVVVPRPLRDMVYEWVGRHRYGWFGKRETCMTPSPEVRGRFVD
jgi:predicted DCC family thiol-disulfide oxidoreductase YuxK